MKMNQNCMKKILAGALVMSSLAVVPTYAGNWVQPQAGTWMYEENGTYTTGWVKAEDGQWYEMDENGVWIVAPEITEDTVGYLLENAVNKAGLYQNENREILYRVIYSEKGVITVSLSLEEKPLTYTNIVSFEVNTKTRVAHPVIGKDLVL